MTRIMTLERTKSGRPALWEQGGGSTNTGRATIIAASSGDALRPYYIRTRGHLSNDRHALMPVGKGTLVVKANHHRGDYAVSVHRVTAINGDEASLETIWSGAAVLDKNGPVFFDGPDGTGEINPPEFALPGIVAAMKKASDYHCRSPYFYKPAP